MMVVFLLNKTFCFYAPCGGYGGFSYLHFTHKTETVYSHESKGLYIAVHMKYSGYLFLS